jgi:hypothetical protein
MPVVIEEFEVALQGPAREAEGHAGAAQAQSQAPVVLQDAIVTLLAREAERALRLSDA